MNVKGFVISIAIMILTISVVIYGVNSIYTSPEYTDFCSSIRDPSPLGEDVACPTVCIEMWELDTRNGDCFLNECGSGCGPDGINTFEELKHCEIALSGENCWDVYEEKREKHSRSMFLIALPLGIAIIVFGLSVFTIESIGTGLMSGGVGVVFWGVGGFWRFADDWLKFIISLAGLIVLIWVTYSFNEKLGKKKARKRKRKR